MGQQITLAIAIVGDPSDAEVQNLSVKVTKGVWLETED